MVTTATTNGIAASRDPAAHVFKIVDAEEWRTAVAAGIYHGSSDDRASGFIHFSARHQLAATAARHFAGRHGLLLAAFAAADLGPALVWEPSRGGDLFPHLYGSLDPAAARWVRPLPLGVDGVHQFPDGLVT
jgi:uncharacterized protein (DUF952 family)